MVLLGKFALAESRHTCPEDAGGIRHCAHDCDFFLETALDHVRGDRRGHGNQQLLSGHVGADLAHHVRDNLGLDTQEHDIRATHGFAVVGAGVHLQLVLQKAGAFGMRDCHPCLARLEQSIAQKRLQKD